MSEPVDPNAYPGYSPPPASSPQPPYGQAGNHQPPFGYAAEQPYGSAAEQPYSSTTYDPSAAWPGGPAAWPGGPPAAPSNTRRNVIIVVAVVVLLALAGGLTWALVGRSDPDRLAAPDSFGGYTRLTNDAARTVESGMRALANTAPDSTVRKVFDAATIAAYAKDSGDRPVLVMVALPTSSAGGAHSPDAISQMLLQGGVPDSSTYPSGGHGGVTRCGSAQFGAAPEAMCSWSDDKTSGVLVSVNPPLPPAALAQVVGSLRDALD